MTWVSSGTISCAGAHRRPDAEIDCVAAHHPAQEQVQALAGAAGGRPRKEVADAGALRARGRRRARMSSASARCEKLSSAPPTSTSGSASPSAKNASSDPRLLEHLPQDPQQRREIDAARPAVHHRPQLGVRRAPARTRGRTAAGRGPMMRNSGRDRVEHAGHAAERERRGAEAGDLPIRRIAERPHAAAPDRSPNPRG